MAGMMITSNRNVRPALLPVIKAVTTPPGVVRYNWQVLETNGRNFYDDETVSHGGLLTGHDKLPGPHDGCFAIINRHVGV